MQEDLIEHMRFESPQEDITTDINIALNENRATKKLKVCTAVVAIKKVIYFATIMSLSANDQAMKNNKLLINVLISKEILVF